MTHTYYFRSDLTSAAPSDPNARLLDWAPDEPTATIQIGRSGAKSFFDGWRAPRVAADLMLLGSAAYCIDKTALRPSAADRWTREIELELPVQDPGAWNTKSLEAVLDFLTGDRWTIRLYEERMHPLDGVNGVPVADQPVEGVDGVCLFSGGLDSLTGVIDLLEEDADRRLCLVSHHEGGQASTAQEALLSQLVAHYGEKRLVSRRLFLRPAPANSQQYRPLPSRRESTTRSRSLLFLTTALSLAASVGADTPVYIPENGFIGINAPLTRARSGSYSTRTTHPHFIALLANAASAAGVANPIENPYRLQTKGEILANTRNSKLLRRLAPLSVSCSHPEAARYVKRPQGNCGYCFPCLIRRSSMAHVGWDEGDAYAWDSLSGEGLLNRNTQRAADLRAVINGVFSERPNRDIIRNGPIPNGEHSDFIRVWRTGLDELRSWFDGATGPTGQLIAPLR